MHAYPYAAIAVHRAEATQDPTDIQEGERRQNIRRAAGSRVLSSLKKLCGLHSLFLRKS